MITKIVILANSRKFGNRCVAGKDFNGRWIRFTQNGCASISVSEAKNYNMLKILDVDGIINIPSREYGYHTENSNYTGIEVVGELNRNVLDNFLDDPDDIFGNGRCLSEVEVERLNYSLLFVKVTDLCIYIKDCGQYPNKLRGQFTYKNKTYTDISVTYSQAEEYFNGFSYPYQESYQEAYLTISLGGIFNGFAYKLISGILLI